jgi:hypothetical protein
MSFVVLQNLDKGPDRRRALANCRRLVLCYVGTCSRTEWLRLQAAHAHRNDHTTDR